MILSLFACALFYVIFNENEKRKGQAMEFMEVFILVLVPYLLQVVVLIVGGILSWPQWAHYAVVFAYLIIPALMMKAMFGFEWSKAGGYALLLFFLVNVAQFWGWFAMSSGE